MPTDRSSIQALRNLLTETDLLISTTDPMPQNRTPRCRELLKAAIALTDDLLKQQRMTAGELLGRKGGSATAARLGSDHFRQLAAKRKTHGGGRPRKQAE
jgi:hypothetical protein